MSISKHEKERRLQWRAEFLDFIRACIDELDDTLRMGMGWVDAVAVALNEYGYDIIEIGGGDENNPQI